MADAPSFMRPGPVPSIARRGAVALAVLVAFYLTTTVIALALVPIPVLAFMAMDRVNLWGLLAVTASCWIPAGLLLSGLLGARPPRFTEPGLRLEREEAPALFALLDELATAANTKVPHDVYVSPVPELCVAETGGGFFGLRSRRVLCIGAPLLATSTVGELRAMLAHELGHYLGGDTRLSGVLAFTEGAFRSVLEATQRGAFHQTGHWAIELAQSVAGAVGRGIVKVHARVYLRLTRPTKRLQELAADALAGELAGRETAIRALEHAHILWPLYAAYLELEVRHVVALDVMPTDLLEGFERFRARVAERGELAELTSAVRRQETDPFDTHPALAERVAALRAGTGGSDRMLDESARTLLDGSFDLDTWLVDATLPKVDRPVRRPVQRMTWAQIATHVHPRQMEKRGRDVAARLHPCLPHAATLAAMLGAVGEAFQAGRMTEIVMAVEPTLASLPRSEWDAVATEIAERTLAVLFEGALVERGAVVEASLGEPCMTFRGFGQTVRPRLIATRAMSDNEARCELGRWTTILLAPPTATSLTAATSLTG